MDRTNLAGLEIKAPPARPQLKKRQTLVRAADVLIEILHRAGVRTIFGIPGGAISSITDALLDRPDIRVITTRHEGGAMFAACGYARATQQPAVVMVTSGPGVLNCLTGLASAFCDGLPVIVLAGEVPRKLFGKRALQEGSANHLNVVGMAKHITKLAMEVTDPNAAPAVMRRALMTAVSGRPGPVLLSLPLDITSAQIQRPGIASEVSVACNLDPFLLQKVAGTLATAEHPVIFAGSGCRWGDGPARLKVLAERLQIPVMTTPKGKGVFSERHPLSLGVFGHGGHPSSTEYLEEGVDVLLAVGTGLSDPATNGWSDLLSPSEHFIQIDTDALQMGRNYPVSVGLVGRADSVLEQITAHLAPQPRPARAFGVRRYTDPEQEIDPKRLITPSRALWELQRAMPPDTAFASDIGEHLLFATHYLEAARPDDFLIMTGLASMGSGIAGALGIKLAQRERPVAAVVGDGCFAMSIGDLATASREALPLLVAVLNDGRYGMVERGHLNLFGRTPPYPCTEVRIEACAKSVGADAEVIERPGQILELDLEARLAKGPVVLDVRIDPGVRLPDKKRDEQLAMMNRKPR